MEAIREYLLSVTTGAVICALVRSLLTGCKSQQRVIRLLCGVFLLFIVIKPLTEIPLPDLSRYTMALEQEVQTAVDEGVDYASQARERLIKEKLEAYIQDKAAGEQVQLDVQVVLDSQDPPVPKTVIITGALGPGVRARLQQFLEEELGIPKENQIWKQS